MKFSPVISELTGLICKRQIRHGQKTGTFYRLSPDTLDRFSPYESALCADDGSVPHFPIFQGTLPWQPNNIVKMLSTPTDAIYIHCTSAGKRIQYHGLAVCVNSRDDGATSYKNLVNIYLITPEMTGLNCVRLVLHGQKLANIVEYFRIYWTDFRNLFIV